MAETQTFQNHVRWYPLVHFFVMPVLLINLIWQIVRIVQEPGLDRAEFILLSVALIGLAFAARLQALKVQDRVIKLEESLRFYKILPPELAAQAENLPTSYKLALRFASDDELPEMVQRTVSGEFTNTKEIKLAVKNWRGDYLRA